MRTVRHSALITTFLLLLLGSTSVFGQTTKSTVPLADAVTKLKSSSEELLRLQADESKKASDQVELLRQLYSEGLIAKVELDEAEQTLAAANAKLTTTQNQINGSEKLLSDIKQAEALAKSQAATQSRSLVKPTLWTPNSLSRTATILRSSGIGSWSLNSLSNVQQFFTTSFGRALPTSAVGQSSTHNRLGYDHRNAVDVALHPDSVEGRALISYLQTNGIPFLAFRAAVPGVATGPHIHIGNPSHRLG